MTRSQLSASPAPLAALQRNFQTTWQIADTPRYFYAPGRVNLIGEYTDFNGGLVLPCAIDYGTRLAVVASNDSLLHFATDSFSGQYGIPPTEQDQALAGRWCDYPLGVINEFRKAGHSIGGLRCYFSGDIPPGAGLSSSASISVCTAVALNTLFQCKLSFLELAQIAQRAENHFVGVQCGIMDQYASAMAIANHAMALDCNTLQAQQVPLTLADYEILIGNTHQQRELADSAYNERVEQCNAALAILGPVCGADNLAGVSSDCLQNNLHRLVDQPVAQKRARHVVGEQQRVLQSIEFMREANLHAFGELMNQSHESLDQLFEVSSEPLNNLVKHCRDCSGVLGSRLTGAGFGGCTVSLVHRDAVDDLIAYVTPRYQRDTGLQSSFYRTSAAAGAGELTET